MISALLKSGQYSKGYVSEDHYQAIKSLYRHKATLMQEMKNAKRQVSTTLVVVFPEFEQIIKDPFSVSGMALLEKYPTAKHYKDERAYVIHSNLRRIRLLKEDEVYIADLVDNLRSIDGVADKTIFAILRRA